MGGIVFPFGSPVVLRKRVRSAPDALGNDTFTMVETLTIGAYNPGGSVEYTDGRATVVTQPTVYLPPEVDVSAIDEIDVAGRTWEVDGTPRPWANPFTGWAPGVEVQLKGVTG